MPELLALLALEGRIVTADAMHCQKATAQTILDRGGDYVLALKANQPALFEDACGSTIPRPCRATVPRPSTAITAGSETRRALVGHDIAWLAERHDFPGLAAVAKVTATRETGAKTTTASRYFLLSKPLTAAHLAQVVRSHWHIENRLHWMLDVVMDEDGSRGQRCRPRGSQQRRPA